MESFVHGIRIKRCTVACFIAVLIGASFPRSIALQDELAQQLAEWARSGANADEFVLSPGDFHKAEKIDLANGLRLYWLDGMAPNSTYEVRVAYTGTSRIRVHLTPAGVFTKDDEIIHIMDHRGETIVMSNSYQSKINAFSADMDLIRHTQARSERTLAECGGCSSTDDDFEPSRLEGGTTDLQSSRPPDDSANMDGPCCSDAPAGGQADAWPVRRRRGRMLKDVEKVVFVTDASGGIRGGRAAVVMQVIRDGVHFTGAALPEDMVYHVVLMRMAGAIPFDAFFLVAIIVALSAFTVWIVPRWQRTFLPSLLRYISSGRLTEASSLPGRAPRSFKKDARHL